MADPFFRVDGANAMLELAKRVRASQGAPLVKEMTKAAGMAVKPVTPLSRRKALERLPRSGGLAARVAKSPQRVTSRVGRTTASVRVTVAGKKSGAYGANVGTVRHPVFDRAGRPRKFVDQKVPPGWFDDAVDEHGPQAIDTIVGVLTDYAKRL